MTLSFSVEAGRSSVTSSIRVAGIDMCVHGLMPSLLPFAAPAPTVSPASLDAARALLANLPGAQPRATFDQPGYVGGRDRHLRCVRGSRGWRMTVAGLGDFGLDEAATAVGWMAPAPDIESPPLHEVEMTLLGPPLVLALSTRGRWCLHASALSFGDGAIAVLGVSGAGKSTLAGWMDAQGRADRVSDDMLPLTVEAASVLSATGSEPGSDAQAVASPPSVVSAWPAFPQLKLPAEAQWQGPESLSLVAACVLEPAPPDAKAVIAEPMARPAAALAFVRHTVGVRLFDLPLTRAHMAAAADMASVLPLWRLRVPRVWPALDAAAEVLARLPREGDPGPAIVLDL